MPFSPNSAQQSSPASQSRASSHFIARPTHDDAQFCARPPAPFGLQQQTSPASTHSTASHEIFPGFDPLDAPPSPASLPTAPLLLLAPLLEDVAPEDDVAPPDEDVEVEVFAPASLPVELASSVPHANAAAASMLATKAAIAQGRTRSRELSELSELSGPEA